MTDPTFGGFAPPTANFSHLPHQLIDAFPLFETKAELMVVLYILRHTWGFGDDDKKITVDEFMNGRKRKNGTRIDKGVGMSKPSVIEGLRRAEDHGFISIETDDTDKGRVKKFYRLREVSDFFTPEVKFLYPNGKETLPRSEKETLERNKPSPASGDADVSPSEKPKTPRKRNLMTDAVTIHFFETALGTNPETEKLAAFAGNWLAGKSTGTRNIKLEKLLTPLTPDDVPCVVAYFKAKNPDANVPHDLRKIAKWTYEWINAGKPTAPSANGHNPLAGRTEITG